MDRGKFRESKISKRQLEIEDGDSFEERLVLGTRYGSLNKDVGLRF